MVLMGMRVRVHVFVMGDAPALQRSNDCSTTKCTDCAWWVALTLCSRPQLACISSSPFSFPFLYHLHRLMRRYAIEEPHSHSGGNNTGDHPLPPLFSAGRVSTGMMAQHLLPAGPASLALMCGPVGMLEGAVIPGLAELGFNREAMVVF